MSKEPRLKGSEKGYRPDPIRHDWEVLAVILGEMEAIECLRCGEKRSGPPGPYNMLPRDPCPGPFKPPRLGSVIAPPIPKPPRGEPLKDIAWSA